MPLPLDFQTQTRQLLGADRAEALFHALTETEASVSVRRNPRKPTSTLPAEADGTVAWASEGQYLKERPKFTFDPLLHAGCYYVQEAASMFVEAAYRRIVEDFTPQRLLDLCAAPGGKSTLWRSLLPDGALLVANEPMRQRAQILAENLTKWGQPDVVTTNAFPDELSELGSFFDVIAADVPCSGEGMFRKDQGAVEEWSAQAVIDCAARQWQIIEAIWPALREGGYLVYSTCTYNRAENEDNVVRICRELGAELVRIDTPEAWGISGDATGRDLPVYHFYPHLTRGEGLFLALLRKTSEAPILKEKKKKGRGKPALPPVKDGKTLGSWLGHATDFKLLQADEEHLIAVRESLLPDVEKVTRVVRSLTAGILMAEVKGRKLIPQHALALSLELNKEAFPMVELSREEALSYLRREVLTLPAETPRGYAIVCFESHPLGFVNNLGARANNLYPAEWRIRN